MNRSERNDDPWRGQIMFLFLLMVLMIGFACGYFSGRAHLRHEIRVATAEAVQAGRNALVEATRPLATDALMSIPRACEDALESLIEKTQRNLELARQVAPELVPELETELHDAEQQLAERRRENADLERRLAEPADGSPR